MGKERMLRNEGWQRDRSDGREYCRKRTIRIGEENVNKKENDFYVNF